MSVISWGPAMPGARRTTQAVDLSILLDPIAAALTCDINWSASLEHRLRQRMQEELLAQNAESIGAYNCDVEEHGSFGDTLRTF